MGQNQGKSKPDDVPSVDMSGSGKGEDPHRSSGSKVPTTFKWTMGGTDVYVVGSFSNWQQKVPLDRTGAEMSTTIDLAPGKYEYKFVVDGEWRCSGDQMMTKDNLGNENNFIEVRERQDSAPTKGTDSSTEPSAPSPPSPLSSYTSEIELTDDYSKEPPTLPPHLKLSLLNHAPWRNDPHLLPVPQHVTVNHLYTAPSVEGVMVMGVTNRFRTKFVTTVLYTNVPSL
jgi:5'-AMP-activated protein kinase regulatory beta subunit